MDGYSYSNIFETKGVEYLIIIGFLILLVPFWLWLSRKKPNLEKIGAGIMALQADLLSTPRGVYFARNHTWLHLEKTGHARIGMSDLLFHITGKIQVRFHIKEGESVSKGDLVAELFREQKKLPVFSPVSGEVWKVNELIESGVLDARNKPYNEGWLFLIQPVAWKAETKTYLLSEEAVRWVSDEIQRLKDFISISSVRHNLSPQVVLQEGGELMDEPLKDLPSEIWDDFGREFLSREG